MSIRRVRCTKSKNRNSDWHIYAIICVFCSMETTTVSTVIVKEQDNPIKASAAKPPEVAKGFDNPAFEPNAGDRDSHVNLPLISRPPTHVRGIRSSAFSIRSNSTEADPDGPGEWIMVTTTAEVHKTQETCFEDVNRNSSSIVHVDEPFTFVIAENAQEQNQLSPTLSYLSGGRISHKTSLESINSDPQQNTAIENQRKSSPVSNHYPNNNHQQQPNNINPSSRSSSASRLNEPPNQRGDSSAPANNNAFKSQQVKRATTQDGPKNLQNATPNRTTSKRLSPVKGPVPNGNIAVANNKSKEAKPQLVSGVSPINAKSQQR